MNTDLNSCAVFMFYAFKIGVLFDSERAASRHQTGWIIDKDESVSEEGVKLTQRPNKGAERTTRESLRNRNKKSKTTRGRYKPIRDNRRTEEQHQRENKRIKEIKTKK